jgi:glycosyltransferase involved in cell wall biosynthesis
MTPPVPRVAVLVDLPLESAAGGHVKCWERFAEAAVAAPGELDLTVFFLGEEAETRELAPHVRYRLLPACLGTRRLGLESGAGHTDLASWHPGLARELADIPVLQATSSFAFARTARRLALRSPRHAYLNALHTDVVRFTRVYARRLLEGWLPGAWLRGLLLDRLDLPGLAAARIGRRLAALLEPAEHVFAANPEDLAFAAGLVGPERTSLLRRGIDRRRFDPARRDRAWLEARFGIAPGTVVLLFAGRVDATKRAGFTGELAAALRAEGLPVCLLVAGEGADLPHLRARLGDGLIAPGVLDQDTLARVMASSDLFVFPSLTETIGNVAIEARASGLPVLVAAAGAARQALGARGEGGVAVAGDTPADWLAALRPLVVDAGRRQQLSAAAAADSRRDWPDWLGVLRADLLPVWQAAALRCAVPSA